VEETPGNKNHEIGNKVPSSGNTKRHFHGYKNLSFVGYDGIDFSFESDSFDLVVTRYAF
jgi:hypothetical protein